MQIRMQLEASRSPQGCLDVSGNPTVDALDLSELLRAAEKGVDAHPAFLRDVNYPARFVVLGDGAWKVELRARRLGVTGMNRRYREIDGEGPTPDLAVSNLTEGLDHLAEEMK